MGDGYGAGVKMGLLIHGAIDWIDSACKQIPETLDTVNKALIKTADAYTLAETKYKKLIAMPPKSAPKEAVKPEVKQAPKPVQIQEAPADIDREVKDVLKNFAANSCDDDDCDNDEDPVEAQARRAGVVSGE